MDRTRLLIGFPRCCPSLVLKYAPLARQVRATKLGREMNVVEFIPMCETAHTGSYSSWLQDTTETEDNCVDLRMQYLQEAQTNKSALLDKVWEEDKLGWTVYSGALLVAFCGEQVYVPDRDIQHNYMLSDSTVSALHDAFAKEHGDENVFVSRQLIPVEQFRRESVEFFAQGHARLVSDEKYWRHVYDTQVHPAGEMFIPLYAIPVSILKKWDRVISYQALDAFEKGLTEPVMDRKDMNGLVNTLHPGAMVLRPAVCHLGMVDKLVANYKQFVTRSGIEMPDETDAGTPPLPNHQLRAWLKKIRQNIMGK